MSKTKKIVLVIFTIITLLFATSFSAFASDTVSPDTKIFNYSFARPSVTDYQGYAEVLFTNGSSCLLIYRLVSSTDSNNRVTMDFLYDDTTYGFRVASKSMTADNTVACYAYRILPDGSLVALYNSGSYVGSTSGGQIKFFYNLGTNKIANVHFYGCGFSNLTTSSSGWTGKTNFVFNYASDSLALHKLDKIYSAISGQSDFADKITSNADKNSNAIQDNNDKNTQNIIDNQNQLAEQEKTETQNSGNNSVNDVSSSVPDKSAGMLSALQSLSNAVSYTGTVAKWKFPQMYIPAISGVTDRINLNSEMEIDFTFWINKIPQDIRTIISALATIGLVIFAFKELYGLISYVLTLKGGGNNE